MLRLFYWLQQTFHILWSQLLLWISPRTKKKCYMNNSQQNPLLNETLGPDAVILPFKDMPTARGLPIVGTLFDLLAAGAAPKLHKYIDSRHKELGSIFRERLSGAPDTVFVASASLMRSVFLYEGPYPRHPLPHAWQLLNTHETLNRRGLFFMDGPEWIANRRIVNRFLLNGKINWINPHIEECNERLINAWQTQIAHSDREYTVIENLEHQLYRWSINVTCSIMFGSMSAVTDEIEAALDEFSNIVHMIFKNSAVLMTFPPNLARMLNLRMWKDFEESVKEVLRQGGDIVDMYIARNAAESENTIQDAELLYNKLEQSGMELLIIKRIFVDLIIAAGDTTTYSTEWSLYLLSQHAELQQCIARESIITKAEKASHTSVQGLIRETLRLYPVAPFIGRYMDSDCVLGNYSIKKDTLVILSLYTAGRDPDHFPDPLAFKPDRWKRDTETGRLQGVTEPHGTMPFAIGNRSCIGRKVVGSQMETLIGAITRNFQLKCLNDNTIDCILRLVTVPDQPLKIGLKLRTDNF